MLARSHHLKIIKSIFNHPRGIGTYPLPWPHLQKQFPSTTPPWNKVAGLHLLNRVIKSATGGEFKAKEFLEGVEDSTKCFVQSLKDRNLDVLKEILHPKLYHKVFHSLCQLPPTSQILTDVESIRHLKLTNVNSIVGTANSDDEHTISLFGQTIVTSQNQMEELLESQKGTSFDYELAKKIGKEATMSHMEFILTVTFTTKEKFAILDNDGKLIEGSNKFINGNHIWKYGSTVLWDNDYYPFEWKLYDINDYLQDANPE